MLNLLVDKAIERSTPKPETDQPIFTISYSSISNKFKSPNAKESQSKTAVNRIPKINKKDNNVFQKWKSKTIQKLKDMQPAIKKAFLPVQPIKNMSLKPKSMGFSMDMNQENQYNPDQIRGMKASFIVHTTKIKTKAYSFQEPSSQSPLKSVYLQYKDENKQKKRKMVTVSNFYQKKLIQTQMNKTIQASKTSLILKSEESEEQQQTVQNEVNNDPRRISFFNTIQYKTVPKEQIKHYKFDQFENSKRNILTRTANNSFLRSSKKPIKPDMNLFSNTMTAIKVTNCRQERKDDAQQKPTSGSQKINIRKVYTQKRSRKLIKECFEEDPETMRVRIDNYRPWSPVKTNPLFIHDDDLLFEKSKTFNIFSNLEETLEEKI